MSSELHFRGGPAWIELADAPTQLGQGLAVLDPPSANRSERPRGAYPRWDEAAAACGHLPACVEPGRPDL